MSGTDRRGPLPQSCRRRSCHAIMGSRSASDIVQTIPTLDLYRELEVDPAAAAHLAEVFAFIEAVVESWRSSRSELVPTVAQLWPEHFDLGCSAVEINFGGSPGDDGRPEPYLYVGPWTQRVGSFWNEPYGAACSLYALGSVADGVAFFEQGLAEATRR